MTAYLHESNAHPAVKEAGRLFGEAYAAFHLGVFPAVLNGVCAERDAAHAELRRCGTAYDAACKKHGRPPQGTRLSLAHWFGEGEYLATATA